MVDGPGEPARWSARVPAYSPALVVLLAGSFRDLYMPIEWYPAST
jgi:hypothetical protein